MVVYVIAAGLFLKEYFRWGSPACTVVITTPLKPRLQTNTSIIQGDQKVSVHLMITIHKVTSNVQSFPRQSPNIY
jgi:hypothetical protein